jgi:WD40 repeat protein
VRLLDLSSRKWGRIYPVKDVCTVAVSPDEKTLVVTDHDQAVKLFNLESGKELLSFKERAINMMPRLGSLGSGAGPAGLEFGPTVQFVDDAKHLRVTLNDGKTVVYHDAATGARLKTPPRSSLTFPGGAVRALAVSRDRRMAVTTTLRPSVSCTVWQRGPAGQEKKNR